MQESYTSAESFRCCRRCAVDSSARNRHLRNPTGGHGNRWEDQWYGQSHLVNKVDDVHETHRRPIGKIQKPSPGARNLLGTSVAGTEANVHEDERKKRRLRGNPCETWETRRKPQETTRNPQETRRKPVGNPEETSRKTIGNA